MKNSKRPVHRYLINPTHHLIYRMLSRTRMSEKAAPLPEWSTQKERLRAFITQILWTPRDGQKDLLAQHSTSKLQPSNRTALLLSLPVRNFNTISHFSPKPSLLRSIPTWDINTTSHSLHKLTLLLYHLNTISLNLFLFHLPIRHISKIRQALSQPTFRLSHLSNRDSGSTLQHLQCASLGVYFHKRPRSTCRTRYRNSSVSHNDE